MKLFIRLASLLLLVAILPPVNGQPAETAQEESVKPNINDRFVDAELKVEDWLKRFEVESREVFAVRDEILRACRIKSGFRVADVGAGTGLFTRLISQAVGKSGWVYAIDISPKFLQHINSTCTEKSVDNVTCVLCSDRSIGLPANSVDVIFVCDTYHHFEYPKTVLASIHNALKPNGVLVIVDFERIPGKSREFIMGHVRAGKQVFREEIENAGFELEREVNMPQLKENYFLRFRKSKNS